MRTLGEIISSVKTGERPDYDDLRYALCALEALWVLDSKTMMEMAIDERGGKRVRAEFWYSESYARAQRAINKDPKSFLGWHNDPDNPECCQRRKLVFSALSSNNKSAADEN